jgi:hypothetical protein
LYGHDLFAADADDGEFTPDGYLFFDDGRFAGRNGRCYPAAKPEPHCYPAPGGSIRPAQLELLLGLLKKELGGGWKHRLCWPPTRLVLSLLTLIIIGGENVFLPTVINPHSTKYLNLGFDR